MKGLIFAIKCTANSPANSPVNSPARMRNLKKISPGLYPLNRDVIKMLREGRRGEMKVKEREGGKRRTRPDYERREGASEKYKGRKRDERREEWKHGRFFSSPTLFNLDPLVMCSPISESWMSFCFRG